MNDDNSTVPSHSRREFIRQSGLALVALSLPFPTLKFSKDDTMKENKKFDVIIVGGSYSGLAAAMALGRALKKVLIIDGGKPCNAQTPHSHNFLTQDGKTPLEIATLAKQQVENYDSVTFFEGFATNGKKIRNQFEIQVTTSETFLADKLIFATGIKDKMPAIEGFSDCWGISMLHCPYCHGYEVRNEKTGILGNGEHGNELAKLISNWTNDLTLYTNGKSTLSDKQTEKLLKHQIKIVEKEIQKLDHNNGYIQNIIFKDGTKAEVKAMYSRNSFEQNCAIPESLGCELNDEGYIKVNPSQETSIDGVYACGDNVTRLRSVANSVAMGTAAGMMVSKKMILEQF
ncbi:NAD(P)/FAD-dependent oxidoreductase [Flavobacterium paronense]|uniref:NAD(P)/FAD-dependent oxidoreductase n=1 Tax=Flavobacterium paronense TaxID=1392775 RepID=A0ABV5GBK9_9FLAO|nr:NAD(P)/FAD-dependent oxidoreductase [Flavobacterium paronense]MDN3677665.1 NAD(P)/FAD-dependent oxidoreductase [Flavobacterium paronense]